MDEIKFTEAGLKARRAYAAEYRHRNIEKQRAYMKAWRESHKENIQRSQAKYWEKKAREAEQAEIQTADAAPM